MNKLEEIMMDYTAGRLTLEKANQALEKLGGLRLDPEKNVLSEAEKRLTVIGCYPDQASGWGLLNTGTSTMDKVHIDHGKLMDCDVGGMYALCFVAGRMYHVKGNTLVD